LGHTNISFSGIYRVELQMLNKKEQKEYIKLIQKSLNNQLVLNPVDNARYDELRLKEHTKV